MSALRKILLLRYLQIEFILFPTNVQKEVKPLAEWLSLSRPTFRRGDIPKYGKDNLWFL
jgi:hypothetical protein